MFKGTLLASELMVPYFEISAKDNVNINECMWSFFFNILTKVLNIVQTAFTALISMILRAREGNV